MLFIGIYVPQSLGTLPRTCNCLFTQTISHSFSIYVFNFIVLVTKTSFHAQIRVVSIWRRSFCITQNKAINMINDFTTNIRYLLPDSKETTLKNTATYTINIHSGRWIKNKGYLYYEFTVYQYYDIFTFMYFPILSKFIHLILSL